MSPWWALIKTHAVQKIGDNQYDIFAGQRRFLAMKQLGWTKIPCIVTDVTDDVAKTRSLIENFHRQDNTYEEKVKAFTELYENHCQKDLNKLSKLVGLKQTTIKRYLRLSTLPLEILSHLDTKDGEKRLTLKNADDLVGIDNDKCIILTTKLLENNLSTTQIREAISEFKQDDNTDQIDDIINKVIVDTAQAKDLLAPTCPWFYDPDDPKHKPIIISKELMKPFYQLYQKLKAQ
jgi:ParB family chromosome partitioning protein